MSLEQDDIRGLLQPFIDSLKNPEDFSEQTLFDGREALKRVFDRTNSPSKKSQAQAFWSIQALVGGLIRKGHVDQVTALGAIGGILESLVDWAESAPGASSAHSMGVIQGGLPQAASYLKLAELPAYDESEGSGENAAPFVPASENSLGQLLVNSGKLSNAQLSRALSLQNLNGRRLGEVLIAMEAVGIQTLEEALSRQRFLNKCKSTLPINEGQQHRRMGQ